MKVKWLFALWAILLSGVVTAQSFTNNQPKGPVQVFKDDVHVAWSQSAWRSTVSRVLAPGGYGTSDYALKVDYDGTWGGLELDTQAPNYGGAAMPTREDLTFLLRVESSDTSNDTELEIQVAMHMGQSAPSKYLKPQLYRADKETTPFALGEWYLIRIPVKDFFDGPVPELIGGLIFLTNETATVYYDEVMLSDATQFALAFPLVYKSAAGLKPWNQWHAKISSVFDHAMDVPYGMDGMVVAWTGEAGAGEPESAGCYGKLGGGVFSVQNMYVGGGTGCDTNELLNYDNHPGIDYPVENGNPVLAAAAGTVVNFGGQRCIPKLSEGCNAWGAVGISHGGYVSQYLHLSQIDVVAGEQVNKGDVLGKSGNKSPPGKTVGQHLHLEVLQRVGDGSSASHYLYTDPYGWGTTGSPAGEDWYTHAVNICLWETSCP